ESSRWRIRCLTCSRITSYCTSRLLLCWLAIRWFPVEHLHFADNDFSAVTICPVLCLPFSSTQRSLNVDLAPLAQILPCDLTKPIKENQPMPFGFFLWLAAVFIFPLLACRRAYIGNGTARRHIFNLRVLPQRTNQNYFIHASH